MKIGVMLRHLGEPGGIGVYSENVLNALLSIDKKNCYVLCYCKADQLGKFSRFPNVTEKVIKGQYKIWWDHVSIPRFAKIENIDLIYNPKLSIPIFTQCKTVLVMHGAEQFVHPWAYRWHDRVYFSIANPIFCKRADAIIAMTHIGAKDIVKYMRADPGKVHVIHEAYNEKCRVLEKDQVLQVKEKYALPDKYILFVGGLHPIKNFGNLLKAFAEIKGDFPHKLVVVGFKRWKFSKDFQLIDKLGLHDDVFFPGYVADEEIPAFYNLADVFVFPSLYEGFGIPVLEAMACGCPLVTSKTGCSPEVTGDAAILVDPYNSESISDAVKAILKDSNLRERLIEKGFRRAKEFSWEKCAKDTLQLFEYLYDSEK